MSIKRDVHQGPPGCCATSRTEPTWPRKRFRAANVRIFRAARRIATVSLLLALPFHATFAQTTTQDGERSLQAPRLRPEETVLQLPEAAATPGNGRRVLLGDVAPLDTAEERTAGSDDAEDEVGSDATEDENESGPELQVRSPGARAVNGRERVVGRIYVEVGDRYVILQPDGRLQSVSKESVILTERPFHPWSKRQLGLELITDRFPGFQVRTTRRYLYIYDTSRSFSNATGRILESMFPAVVNYCRRQGIEVHDPEFPLVVIMFRTQQDFQAFHKVDDDVIAYYNPITNWIVLYEQSELTQVAPELAFKQAVSTVAHEGVHQILNNTGVQQRLSQWPLWFSEGLAEYFAPTELNRRVRWKGVGLVNDLRMHELSEFYKAHQDDLGDGKLLQRLTHSVQFGSLDYATSWALVHYLARYQRDEFRNCFRQVTKLKPLESNPPGSIYTRHFSSEYVELEEQLVRHLRSLPYSDPILNQTHYVVIVEGRDKPYVTSSPQQLRGIKKKIGSKPFQIRAFPNRQSATAFAKTWEARN